MQAVKLSNELMSDLNLEYRDHASLVVEGMDDLVKRLDAMAVSANLTGRPSAEASANKLREEIARMTRRLVDRHNL